MALFDKAKELSGKVMDKTMQFSSDELIADTIIMSMKKQEKVNAILKQRGSNYRITGVDLEMGVPPKMIFAVRRVAEESQDFEKRDDEKGVTTE
ncbi:hypothetical protein MNBD_GAMMA17-740 [hydrothermal vent metagenome]|uniref:Uncharacterized protein n=1 Tax=hydrothermal vent metagenome TaxID=652676 RepID=A0A3B0ZHQ1_9ZZZZ